MKWFLQLWCLPDDVAVNLDIAGVLWAVVALVLLLAYRRTLTALVKGLSHRISKFEVGGFSVELAKVEKFTPQWAEKDLRKQAAAVDINDSTAGSFREQLMRDDQGEYSVVDLGEGEEWLTSRLYILSIIFERMKGVKCFVFVKTAGGMRRTFVCWAKPEKVRWALARKYPWLEQAYAGAYAELLTHHQAYIVSNTGRLGHNFNPRDPQPSLDLLQKFVGNVQQAPPALPMPAGEWVLLDGVPPTHEHAEWIDDAKLENILGDDGIRAHVDSSIHLKPREEQLAAFLKAGNDYVAVTDQRLQFEYLIDRGYILEQVAEGMGE